MVKTVIMLIVLGILVVSGIAQEQAIIVELQTEDGLILKGDFYPQNEASIGILLLHMNGSDKSAWSSFVPYLSEAGYAILAVDMRGFGTTGGIRNWELAQADIQLWLDWLKAQENIVGVAIIGASVGANLGLIGCANDPDCQTVIALSPGEDFFGVAPAEAIQTGLTDRPILLVASLRDTDSANAIRTFAQIATGVFGVRMYDRGQHGTAYFVGRGAEDKMQMLIAWLTEYAPIPAE